MPTFEFVIQPLGPFSLAAAKTFIEGFPAAPAVATAGAEVRVVFSTEGSFAGAFAVLQQAHRDADVHVAVTVPGTVPGPALADSAPPIDQPRIRRQLERMFSLDVDGHGFAAIGQRDRIIGELQQRYDMLRPVMFPSPYEAAAWAVLSQRISMKQATVLKQRIARAHGQRIVLDGSDSAKAADVFAFPAPATLLAITEFPGIPLIKWQRLQAVATAASAGLLDGERLRAMPADYAIANLQQIPGIGPFSAELIVIRGAGAPDVAPTVEPRLNAIVASRYATSVAVAAKHWAPFRSWCAVLLRIAASQGEPSTCGATAMAS